MKTTRSVEKLELEITRIMQEIQNLQGKIRRRESIKAFSGARPGEIQKCLRKITDAYRSLYDAVGHLVASGNRPQNPQKNLPL
jgi:hypothetical protein